jgi:HEPN domain-containing protein
MKDTDKIVAKFEQLLAEGKVILNNAGYDGSKYRGNHPSTKDYVMFRTEALNLTRRVCGEQSDHYKELRRIAENLTMTSNGYYFDMCFAVVEAAKKDYEGGYLFNLKSLITADILGDFIEQAEALLQSGYHVPAASLAGAILEDTLRKLCEKHSIEVPEITKLDKLNADLAKADVYDKLVQKRITALADIRNNADHGHFDKFSKEDVEDMVSYTRRFTADYLG